MKRSKKSSSPTQKEIADHYDSGYEEQRMSIDVGKLDCERSKELLTRFLPPAPAKIIDVGGGPGGHACWLAKQGYEVHLIDVVPLHVEQAKKASEAQPDASLASVEVGDACSLNWKNEQVDACLFFGPLYHLSDKIDRIKALQEAFRVLKQNGTFMAVGISRFASALDGIRSRFLEDPRFMEIVKRDLKDGQHRNPTEKPEYFMKTFFHHPDELKSELEEVGFNQVAVYGVEGPGWMAQNFDEWWKNEKQKERLLYLAQTLETEPSLLGISAHLMAVGKKLKLNSNFQ